MHVKTLAVLSHSWRSHARPSRNSHIDSSRNASRAPFPTSSSRATVTSASAGFSKYQRGGGLLDLFGAKLQSDCRVAAASCWRHVQLHATHVRIHLHRRKRPAPSDGWHGVPSPAQRRIVPPVTHLVALSNSGCRVIRVVRRRHRRWACLLWSNL